MIILCPSDCEHEYDFAHSLVINVRYETIERVKYRVVTTFVICRSCGGHWVNRAVRCGCECHDNPHPPTVVKERVGMIESV